MGKAHAAFMSVKTFACTFSASAMRCFHDVSLRLTRPISIAGFFALDSNWAAFATAASSGRTGAGIWKRETSGSGGSAPVFDSCSAASRLM